MSLFHLKEKGLINHYVDDDVLLEREITLADSFKISTEAFGLFSFQLHSLGWWSGFWWIDISTSVCKTLVTAFRAANSFLKNIGSGSARGIF